MKASLRFDMRTPAGLSRSANELYSAALDMSAWADDLDFEHIQLTEHHGVEDGYNPSPIVLASAIAARTQRCRIRLGVLVLPLYDPIKVAEDLAVLDLISGGRLDVAVGAGYRASEYEMFDRQFCDRPKLMEESISVLKQAWAGEAFEYCGRRICVTPRPSQRPRPPILLGGTSNAAARRAARIADAFYPTQSRFDAAYFEERERLGLDAGRIERRAGPVFVHVADDPDKTWNQIGTHLLHENMSYYNWQQERGSGHFSSVNAVDDLRKSGQYQVLTPEECINLAHDIARMGGANFQLNPLIGGLNPEIGWQCLELFSGKVLPQLQSIQTIPADKPLQRLV